MLLLRLLYLLGTNRIGYVLMILVILKLKLIFPLARMVRRLFNYMHYLVQQ